MTYTFSERSRSRLATCHPVLQLLVRRVIARPDLPSDFTVLCGHRGEAEQNAAHAAGVSKLRWPKSKHNAQPSLAVDVAPYVNGGVSWDWSHYHPLAAAIKAEWAAMEAEGLTEGYALSWGGDWASFKDGPHWELR